MKVFVGGATGATGRVFVEEALAAGMEVVAHARPQSADRLPPGGERAVFPIEDPAALDAAMRGCDAVLCAIGTMMKRFAQGDSYAASDIGGNRALVESARRVGVPRVVLVGAAGTSWIPGPYYDAKREAERIVRGSGLDWAIARPSGLHRDGRDQALGALDRRLGGAWLDVRPIAVRVVARAIVRALLRGPLGGQVWEGRDLWALAEPGGAR